MDEFQIYGYMTNTDVKFIAVLTDQNKVQESEMRAFFQKCHTSYIEYLRCPFAPIDADRLCSKKFDASIDAHVQQHLDASTSKQGSLGES